MINKGLVDLKELRKLKNNYDFRGKSAYCFIRGNKIIKIYATSEDIGYSVLDNNLINDFSKYKADTIVFPEEYIYENGKIVGEILDYIDDTSIIESFCDNTIVDNIIKSYELVVNDIYTFSNLEMIDLSSVNILYSMNNGFHIIDTTEWKLNKDREKINIHMFSSQIVNTLFSKIDLPITYKSTYAFVDKNVEINACKYGKVGKAFCNVLEMNMNNYYRLLELIYVYKRIYEMHYGKELNTIADMKEITKILKKG